MTTIYSFDLRTGALTGSRPAQVVGGKELTICAGATPGSPRRHSRRACRPLDGQRLGGSGGSPPAHGFQRHQAGRHSLLAAR